MADIDDMLFALAGDAPEDEEDSVVTDASRASSAAPDQKRPGKTAAAKKPNKRRNDDSEEEDGEASSPASHNSAPMDESESESDSSPTMYEEGERYPLEGKFRDAKDKAEIMAMSEINRENVLTERAQEIDRDRQNKVLRQLLHAREAESKKQEKKRKAGEAELEEGQRKTVRQRTKIGGGKVGEASSAIDNLKRTRAERKDRERRREEDRERNKDRRNHEADYSDHDAEGDSEVEWDDGKHKGQNKRTPTPEYRDAEPASLIELEKARLGRSRFAKVCFYPGFNEAITGCYVRICVGDNKETGQMVYRMALIKGFTEDKPYAIEGANGKFFKTSQYVIAAHGKAERNWPFVVCSDSPFTEAEWNRYKQTCQVENVTLPTKPKITSKLNDINGLLNRTWTEAEVQEKLVRSGVLAAKSVPFEKARLHKAIEDAKSTGNDTKAEQLEAELAALEEPKLAYGTSISPKKAKVASTAMNQQERLAILNRENRRKNIEDVRNALIAERRAAKEAEAAVARGEIAAMDFSRRLKTRAKTNHDVADVYRKKETTPNAEESKKDGQTQPSGAAVPPTKPEIKKGLPLIRRPLMDDDIIGAIDLGIDIDDI